MWIPFILIDTKTLTLFLRHDENTTQPYDLYVWGLLFFHWCLDQYVFSRESYLPCVAQNVGEKWNPYRKY